MNKKNNIKTKQSIEKIKNVTCEMLESCGIEKLSIKGVCEKAKLNRTTFYAHFDSIEAVLYEICQEYIIKAYEIFLDTKKTYQIRIKQAMELILERYNFFAYVFENVNNLELRILEIVESYYKDQDFLDGAEYAKLSLAFIISGFVGVGKVYFNSKEYREKMTPEEFAEVVSGVVNQSNPYFMIK